MAINILQKQIKTIYEMYFQYRFAIYNHESRKPPIKHNISFSSHPLLLVEY